MIKHLWHIPSYLRWKNKIEKYISTSSQLGESNAAFIATNPRSNFLDTLRPDQKILCQTHVEYTACKDACHDEKQVHMARSFFPGYEDEVETSLVSFSKKCADHIFDEFTFSDCPDAVKEMGKLWFSDLICGNLRNIAALDKYIADHGEFDQLILSKSIPSIYLFFRTLNQNLPLKNLNSIHKAFKNELALIATAVSATPATSDLYKNNISKLLLNPDGLTALENSPKILAVIDSRETSRYAPPLRNLLQQTNYLDDTRFISAQGMSNIKATPASKFAAYTAASHLFHSLKKSELGSSVWFQSDKRFIWFASLFDFVRRFVPRMIRIYQQAAHDLDARPAALIVAPGRHPISWCYIHEATKRGISTIDFQPIMFSSIPRYRAPICDTCFVVDQSQLELARDFFNVPEEKLIAMGSTRISTEFEPTANQSATTQILIVGQPFRPDDFCLILQKLSSLKTLIPNLEVLLAPHPDDTEKTIDLYNKTVAELGSPEYCRILPKGQTNDYVRSSSLVVTFYSNVGFDAALQGKTVIVLSKDDNEKRPELDVLANIILKTDMDNLIATVHTGLLPETATDLKQKRRDLWKVHPYLKPGSSVEIFSTTLAKLLN